MKIIQKNTNGFWFFKKFSFFLEDEETGSLMEKFVDEKTWNTFNVGDYLDSRYQQFFKYNQTYPWFHD